MKSHHLRLSRTIGLILVGAILCSAQQPASSVRTLKEQVAKLEAIDRNPETSEEVRTLNRKFLNERRSQLQAALALRLETLRKYHLTVKALLSADENKVVEESIAEVERDIEDLKNKTGTSDADTASVDAATSGPSAASTANGTANLPASAAPIASVPAPVIPAPAQKVAPVSATTCSGATNPYQDAPPLLRDAIERVADDIISGAQTPANAISFKFDDMFLYAVAHAVAPAADSVSSIKSLKAYQYLGETVRTDKQIGSPARGAGTTSLIEKPGFARLLGFAVENGAITQEVGTTSLTLSTSPYMLYTFGNGGDTAENYQRAGVLNRIGASATFDLKDQNNVLANASRNQLSEWSVRARLFGDRSTRSEAFQEFWRKPGGPQEAIEKRLAAVTAAFTRVSPGFAPEFDAFTDVKTDLRTVVSAVVSGPTYTAASAENKKQLLTNASLCVIRSEVYNPISSNTFPIAQAKKDEINGQLVPAIAASMRNIEAVRNLLSDKLEEFQKGPLATFAYINHRRPIGSDFSEVKFLYQHEGPMLQPMKLVANFGTSFYNKPNPALNQQRLRDIAVGLSFEGQSNSPFLKGTADLSKITYAFTGSYQRTFENRGVAGRKADIAAFQFKLDVPVFAGLSFPLAVTYANATEQQRKSHVRFNFGTGFDADKLMAIMRLLR
jgi:hypothetical protein